MKVSIICPKCAEAMTLTIAYEDAEYSGYVYKCECGCMAVVKCDKLNEVVEISWL